MGSRRTYGDRCGIARALDVVGERWALLVVRELLLGPKRFTDLRAGLPGLSPDVLSQRLRELEQAGLVRRRKLAPPAGSRVYELTERGLAIEPILLELGRWGSQIPLPEGDAPFSAD
jgi:DNA-binding HxlR family transcriptional regulator